MRLIFRSVVTGGLALAMVVLGFTGTAAAATKGIFLTNGVAIRTCPKTSCTAVGQGQKLQSFEAKCWKRGTTVSGVNVWLLGKNLATGVVGHTSAVYVGATGNGQPGESDRWRYYVPQC